MKSNNTLLLLSFALLTTFCFTRDASAVEPFSIQVSHLQCEYLESPLGIDEARPRLSWRLSSSQRGQKQTACRVLVASSREKLDRNVGDLWDSGKIGSDGSWKFTTDGPITYNSLRAGETYDARKELGDWASPGYEATGWKPALAADAPAGKLDNQDLPPVRVIEEIPAVSVVKHEDGLVAPEQAKREGGYRFDIGVEATGWARLTVRGEPGQEIIIRYPGTDSHTFGRYQECRYICKGGGAETWEPRFAFNGYQFLDVIGLDYEPKPADLVGCTVVSDLRNRGRFACSSPELTKLQPVIRRTLRNYNIQMPMDPVREKAWRIATNPDYPGWFDMVFTQNNSVLKEHWKGSVQMPSLAAPIGAWCYRSLGGIRPDPATEGFKSFIVQPYTDPLEWVECEHECPYGRIRSHWRRKGGVLTMEVSVPVNTTATVWVPADEAATVTESGKPAAQAEGVTLLREEAGVRVFRIESGDYRFTSR